VIANWKNSAVLSGDQLRLLGFSIELLHTVQQFD